MSNPGKDSYDNALETVWTFYDISDSPITIRDYLKTLLLTLWDQLDSFSGKRPFGNSGWWGDLYEALATHGFVQAEVCEFYPDDPSENTFDPVDYDEAHEFVENLIKRVFSKDV